MQSLHSFYYRRSPFYKAYSTYACVYVYIYIYIYMYREYTECQLAMLPSILCTLVLPKVNPLSSVSNSDGLRLFSLFSILFLSPLSALILFYHFLALTVTCVSYYKYDCICKTSCIEKWLMFARVYSLIILVNMYL